MSQSKLVITTSPPPNVVNLQDVKAYLRIESDATFDDAVINSMVETATEKVRSLTGRALLQTTYALSVNDFRDIELPKPPFSSLVSITYIDKNGAEQNLSSDLYRIDDAEEPTVIRFDRLGDLPVLDDQNPLPITINYTSGYSNSAEIPSPIKTYIMMIVGDLYDGYRGTQSQYAQHINPISRSLITPYIVQPL